MVHGQGRAWPVSGSTRPDSRIAMDANTRLGRFASASALAIAASHIAGGLRGPADSGGATFAAAALRESVLGSDARIRGSTAFAAAVWAGSGAAAWTVPAIPRTGSSVSHKARGGI